jgi:predicted MPP superfamily phosphohydrolase
MFWFLLKILMFVADIVWWVAIFKLTRRTLWRVLGSIFMAVMLGMHFLGVSKMVDARHVPKWLLVLSIMWHYLATGVLLPLTILFGCVCLIRRVRRRRKIGVTPDLVEPNGKLQTRREFFGSCAVMAPPLFAIGSTAVALAQLENFRLRRFTLKIPTLPRDLDGLTIAHVSDMHVGRLTSGRVLKKMVETTNSLRADLVLLTGDLIDSSLSDLPDAIALVKAMDSRYGQWMIEGNHDVFQNGDWFRQGVKSAGIPFLWDDSAVATVRGHPIQFFGLRWMGLGWMSGLTGENKRLDEVTALQMREVLKHRQPEAFPILLAHHPHAFDAAVKADLPLTLSGHTHGGQWMLNEKIGVGPLLFRYWSGLYQRGNSQMIVSNGAGNVFPLRINAPAEIVNITLKCG